MDILLSSLVTGLISVFTAIIILRLQEWINKKRMFEALFTEVESNLSLAQKVLPLAELFSRRDKKAEHRVTYFDLQHLYTYSFEDFRRSGYLNSLNQKARELLEEVYELIFAHNCQTETIKSQEVDYSSHLATIATMAPRIGGYSERLNVLMEKLGLLKEELKHYGKS